MHLSAPLGTPPPAGTVPNSMPAELAVTIACAAIACAGLVAAALRWKRSGSPLGVLVILGSGLAVIQEPMVDTLGNMYIPPSHLTVLTTYGREMPAYAPLAYAFYFGIPTLLYLSAARRRATTREFQKLLLGSLALELGFELIAVNANMYTYYGDQPLRLLNLPLHWVTLNLTAAWVAAAAVHIILPHLKGWRIIASPLIVVCAIAASYCAQGWPVFSATHAEAASDTTLVISSLATIAIGMSIVQATIRILATQAPTTQRADLTIDAGTI